MRFKMRSDSTSGTEAEQESRVYVRGERGARHGQREREREADKETIDQVELCSLSIQASLSGGE